MSPEPSASTASPVFHLAIGFVMGAVVVGSSWFATRKTNHANNAIRDVSVSYMYETNPGEASGNNDMPVDSIHFYPGYVVVTGASDQSHLFALDRLRNFQFAPTQSN